MSVPAHVTGPPKTDSARVSAHVTGLPNTNSVNNPVWQFDSGDVNQPNHVPKWQAYDAQAQQALEQAYGPPNRTVKLRCGQWDYEVDLDSMVQINTGVSGRTKRDVRRLAPKSKPSSNVRTGTGQPNASSTNHYARLLNPGNVGTEQRWYRVIIFFTFTSLFALLIFTILLIP